SRYDGSQSQVTADLGVNPDVLLSIVATQNVAGPETFAGNSRIHTQSRSQRGSSGPGTGSAYQQSVAADCQGCRRATREHLGGLGDGIENGLGFERGVPDSILQCGVNGLGIWNLRGGEGLGAGCCCY